MNTENEKVSDELTGGQLAEQKHRAREVARRSQNNLDSTDELCKKVVKKPIRRFKEKGFPMEGDGRNITAEVHMMRAFDAAAQK